MLRRIVTRAASLVGVVTLLGAGVAVAAGRETVTETQHEHNVVFFSEESANPGTSLFGSVPRATRKMKLNTTP